MIFDQDIIIYPFIDHRLHRNHSLRIFVPPFPIVFLNQLLGPFFL